ncbi:hypothetical protein [Celeribacter baekdonensis]|jgi:hypothetical protein|uniref:hypothetical protein n=2 Tax=Celeribacter baekdonensis TaxID=875171 RepID=UPI0030D6DD4B|tara:strand:- start:58886 stop:59764 length:879 start_codon:yes stop_codon:yes gene_type:complete
MPFIRLLFVIFLTVASNVGALHASDGEASYDQHVLLVGEQGALGHRLVSSICFAQAGIDVARNRRVIEQTRMEISTALVALAEGNDAIPPITNGNIRTQIGSVEMVWKGLDKKAATFLSETGLTDEEVLKLTFKSQSLEKLWRNVAQSLELQTSVNQAPEKLVRTRIITTATNQSRLLQEAGKEACLIHLAHKSQVSAAQVETLKDILATFDQNIFELTFVRPASAPAPQSDVLEQAAFNTWQDWVGLETLFEGVIEDPNGQDMINLLPDMSYGIEFLNMKLHENIAIFMSL